jgi:hypothetical protein
MNLMQWTVVGCVLLVWGSVIVAAAWEVWDPRRRKR